MIPTAYFFSRFVGGQEFAAFRVKEESNDCHWAAMHLFKYSYSMRATKKHPKSADP